MYWGKTINKEKCDIILLFFGFLVIFIEMKRSFDELKSEDKLIKQEIKEREEKRQRLNDEMDEAYPGKRLKDYNAKINAKIAKDDRKTLDETLPVALKQILLDDAARTSWPEMGSLVSMTVEPDKDRVNDLQYTYVVRVYLTYERGCRRKFIGVIYPTTGRTYPPTCWEEDGEEEAFKTDPWKWAMNQHEGDPVNALFELLVHGVMALEGTDDELKQEDQNQEDVLPRVWSKVYPQEKATKEEED